LENSVYSEAALLELLGIEQGTLNSLRLDKGFPVVRLDDRHRVYLAEDVLGWLKERVRKC
jgi:hypothetical protein